MVSRLPLVALTTDEIRQRFGLPSGPATHVVMYEAAARLLPLGTGIVWDGIHPGRRNRDQMRSFAEQHNAHLELIFTDASDEVITKRLNDRMQAPELTTSEGKFVITLEHFARIKQLLDVPAPDEGIDTVDTTDAAIEELLRPLVERLQHLVG